MLCQAIGSEEEFIDVDHSCEFFLRNYVRLQGVCLPVFELGSRWFQQLRGIRINISRNVEKIRDNFFGLCTISFFAIEYASHLRYIGRDAFTFLLHLVVSFLPEGIGISSSLSSRDHECQDVVALSINDRMFDDSLLLNWFSFQHLFMFYM
jgi:hypothetical protein